LPYPQVVPFEIGYNVLVYYQAFSTLLYKVGRHRSPGVNMLDLIFTITTQVALIAKAVYVSGYVGVNSTTPLLDV